jgi:hypothetical protein
MRDDSQHGISATVVFAEYLTEKAPNRRDRVEHAIPKRDTMFVENISDTRFGQNLREGKSLVECKAGAHGLQARHGIALKLAAILAAG